MQPISVTQVGWSTRDGQGMGVPVQLWPGTHVQPAFWQVLMSAAEGHVGSGVQPHEEDDPADEEGAGPELSGMDDADPPPVDEETGGTELEGGGDEVRPADEELTADDVADEVADEVAVDVAVEVAAADEDVPLLTVTAEEDGTLDDAVEEEVPDAVTELLPDTDEEPVLPLETWLEGATLEEAPEVAAASCDDAFPPGNQRGRQRCWLSSQRSLAAQSDASSQRTGGAGGKQEASARVRAVAVRRRIVCSALPRTCGR